MATRFQSAMGKLPLVAILRGVTLADAPLILEALLREGFALIEIPLNSPKPLASIEAMRRKAPAEVFIGAGTVLSAADVAAVVDAGGDLVVTPNAEPEVIAAAKARGLICLPGVATPGRQISPRPLAAAMTVGSALGVTMRSPPASATAATSAALITVPAPMKTSAGVFRRIASILASGFGELSGISISANPSRSNASRISGASAGVTPRNIATSGSFAIAD